MENKTEGKTPLPEGTVIRTTDRNGKEAEFTVKKNMGSGGFAYTYRVERTEDKTEYVMKEFFPRGAIRIRETNRIKFSYEDFDTELRNFRKEPERIIKLLERIDKLGEEEKRQRLMTMNLVKPITDAFRYFGDDKNNLNWYFVMEMAPGENLYDSLMKWHGNIYEDMPLDAKLDIVEKVAWGVFNLHETGCIHADIKPENIIISKPRPDKDDWSELTAKLIDYGQVKDLGTVPGEEDRKSKVLDNVFSTGFSVSLADRVHFNKCFNDDDPEKRKEVMLMDIYSLGMLLKFLCLTPKEEQTNRQKFGNNEQVLDEWKLKRLLENSKDRSHETETKLHMIARLVEDATRIPVENRAGVFKGENGFADTFRKRLNKIRSHRERFSFPLKGVALVLAVIIGVAIGYFLPRFDIPDGYVKAVQIEFEKKHLKIKENTSVRLSFRLFPDAVTNKECQPVALRDHVTFENGIVKAKSPGKDTLVIKHMDGPTDTCFIDVVRIKTDSVRFEKKKLTMRVGEKKHVTYHQYPADATEGVSRNKFGNCINTENNGNTFYIDARSPGKGGIVVKHWEAGSDTCFIEVLPPVS